MPWFIRVRIRAYIRLSSHPTGAIIILLLGSALLTNAAYAQIFPRVNSSVVINSKAPTSHSHHQPLVQSQTHGVKIIYPRKGQQVQKGQDLVITGISSGNASSGCQVSVGVNGIKPYQQATPIASRAPNYYSKWSFTLTPKYTPINVGQNKITAKFSCGIDPMSVSHYSVNVTGVTTNNTIVNTNQPHTNQKKQTLLSQTNRSGTNFIAANASSTKADVPVLSNASSHSSIEHNKTHRALSASIHVAKNTIHPGDKQTIELKVSDANTGTAITDGVVSGSIINPSGSLKKSLDTTIDNTGEALYSWTVGHNDAMGNYKVGVLVSASGYGNASASKSFKVTSVPASSSNHKNDINSVQVNSGSSNSNSNHNNDFNHPLNIISLPHIRVPIYLPFK